MIPVLLAFPYSILLITIVCVWWYATIPKNLPPGPIGLPFFGCMFQTWKAKGLDGKLLNWAKQYGPVFKFYVAERLVVVLADWNILHESLVKQGDTFADRPQFVLANDDIVGHGIIASNGEVWKTHRRFALSTLREFGFGKPILETHIKDECEQLIQEIKLSKGRPFDISTLMNNAVSNIICALVFGKRFKYDDKDFSILLRQMRKQLTENGFSILAPFIISSIMKRILMLLPQVSRIMKEGNDLHRFARKQISEVMDSFDVYQDEPTNYIQAYYKAKKERSDNWSFTDDQLIMSVNDLFAAGTDTTATTLRWAILYLAHNPDLQDKLYEEIKGATGEQILPDYADRSKMPLVEATIMECQRMANLLPFGGQRQTTSQCKVNGYDIPAGTLIVPMLSAVLHDQTVYPNPDQFDPYRFLNQQKETGKTAQVTHLIPFQLGKRVCLGESLARMELFLFFTALFSNFQFSFPPDKPIPSINDECISLIRGPPAYEIIAESRGQ